MIIFLYGPDDYRRVEKKREIIAEFKKKRSELGFDVFDLEKEEELPRLEAFLRNQSIFESAKLAALDNAFEMDPKKLAAVLEPMLEQKGVQVLLSEHDKPLKALSFLLEKPALTQKFENLEGAELAAFAIKKAKELGVALAPAAANFLATVYAGSTWALVTELEKLGTLKTSIDKKDLDALDLEAAPNYWALMNGLKSYDMKNRLYALEAMLGLSDPPPKIFNILASQWKEKIPHMAVYDLAIKSGKIDYDEALVDLLVS